MVGAFLQHLTFVDISRSNVAFFTLSTYVDNRFYDIQSITKLGLVEFWGGGGGGVLQRDPLNMPDD